MSKEKGGAIAPLFSLGPVQEKKYTVLYTAMHGLYSEKSDFRVRIHCIA